MGDGHGWSEGYLADVCGDVGVLIDGVCDLFSC